MAEIPIRSFAVSMVALRQDPEGVRVLLLRRTRPPAGIWCQVVGGIEAGETAWQAALRELREETGLVPEELWSGDICEQFYEAHRDAISLLPVFVALIAPRAEVVLNAEHEAHRWVDFAEAREMVPFPGQRSLLRHVEAEHVQRSPSPLLRIAI